MLDTILNYKQEIKLLKNLDLLNNEIILYGAGKLGELAIEILNQIGVIPKLIIDKAPEKRGKLLKGIKIISPDDIDENDKDKSIFAICTVNVPFNELYNFLKYYDCKNIFPFFDLIQGYSKQLGITNGWVCNKLSQDDKDNIIKIYDGFQDDISRALYLQVLYWRIKREEILFKDARVTVGEKFFPKDILHTSKQDEFFIDCGAYNGYIIKDFLKYCNYNFNKIIAFEPDLKNYTELNKYISILDEHVRHKIEICNYGIGDKKEKQYFYSGLGEASRFEDQHNKEIVDLNTIDNIFQNYNNISYLKIHVEGYELKVLKGALKVINNSRPIIGVTIYHNEEGLWKVPKFLMENLQGYVFYNRLHCYCGIASVLYAIPKERIV
ncbi:hypothetical protein psyc5s11_46830 [Clostridium gelidum]|uniref:Methyltransferase FkbM domain-containing protein n=1 Tax=Clostridium gelidum TaxID=704125 RepID=A0ABN6J689_9CLOT|nr:FkbM family methyltransferase [Clostridium gelidum]BCZ48616.1 hypothetical protein psyc5s11_46830 [Clostridium gelidum]